MGSTKAKAKVKETIRQNQYGLGKSQRKKCKSQNSGTNHGGITARLKLEVIAPAGGGSTNPKTVSRNPQPIRGEKTDKSNKSDKLLV